MLRARKFIFWLAVVLFLSAAGVALWLWFRSTPAHAPAAQGTNEESSRGVESVDVPAAQNERSRARSPIIPMTEPLPAGEAWATIDTPGEGEAVPRTFHTTGRCGSLPAGSHLILVVQTGRVVSPKMPPVDISGENWAGTCKEYGAPSGGAFTLCVFIVSEDGLQEIAAWHAQGKATGKYPPFRAVPGGALLAKIKLRVATAGNQ